MASLLSIVESPTHPGFSALYQRLGIAEQRLNSVRKALKLLKREAPDYIVAEFFYGYGNNYAGVHISNLDVLLASLPKYAPAVKVIVLVDRGERQYVEQLNAIYPLHGVLTQPVEPDDITALLG
jgi:DNA-binding NarL/FixJ family response regulator